VMKLDMTVDTSFPDGKDAYHLTEMDCGLTDVEDLKRNKRMARNEALIINMFRPKTGATEL